MAFASLLITLADTAQTTEKVAFSNKSANNFSFRCCVQIYDVVILTALLWGVAFIALP
jgi:hypothetical protein